MIRFQPDTWRDALLRPIAMAAPDGGVYAEIMAPDLRFAAVVALLLLSAVLAWKIKWRDSPVVVLLLFVAASFAVWLFTTGNGRYFIPVLLIVGPLCIGLIYRLPFTRNFRLVMALVLVAMQAIVVLQAGPWGTWGLAKWRDAPFFAVALDEQLQEDPATYVTATSISYSLLAPRFSAASRWVNISSQPDPDSSPDARRVQALLASSRTIRLIIPTTPDHMTPAGLPGPEITKVINGMLGRQKLALADPMQCRTMISGGLASETFSDPASVPKETLAKIGFWVCPLRYPVQVTLKKGNEGSERLNRALDVVEKACPRFFPPGEAPTTVTEGGFLRGYASADMKLYVLQGDKVLYRYWRALNPVLIGSVDDILSGSFKMDCNTIRGRSGLPWERQL